MHALLTSDFKIHTFRARFTTIKFWRCSWGWERFDFTFLLTFFSFSGYSKNFQNLTTVEVHTSLYLPAQGSRELLPTILPRLGLCGRGNAAIVRALLFIFYRGIFICIYLCILLLVFCLDYLCIVIIKN